MFHGQTCVRGRYAWKDLNAGAMQQCEKVPKVHTHIIVGKMDIGVTNPAVLDGKRDVIVSRSVPFNCQPFELLVLSPPAPRHSPVHVGHISAYNLKRCERHDLSIGSAKS